MRYSLWYSRRLDGVLSLLLWRTHLGHESPHAPPSGQGLTCRPHPVARTHARVHPRAVALDPYHWSGVAGNNTTLLVALAAGFGGAFALLLVFGIVMILRNRRVARATDPAPGLRTPLYGE
jgi:hypothetical protein